MNKCLTKGTKGGFRPKQGPMKMPASLNTLLTISTIEVNDPAGTPFFICPEKVLWHILNDV